MTVKDNFSSHYVAAIIALPTRTTKAKEGRSSEMKEGCQAFVKCQPPPFPQQRTTAGGTAAEG
jgi:hypothetical protein